MAGSHSGGLSQPAWAAVERYYEERLLPADPALEEALAAGEAAGLPPISVSPLQGRFLSVLARGAGARRILEIGTLAGYSTIWLARALPAGGRLVTLELEPKHADVARKNLRRAGLEHAVEVRVGPALASLRALKEEGVEPFDLVFIDADKQGYAGYLEHALPLSHPGTLILADNVVRSGEVADPASQDPQVLGVKRFNERLRAERRLAASAVQTVGATGYDGFVIAVVIE